MTRFLMYVMQYYISGSTLETAVAPPMPRKKSSKCLESVSTAVQMLAAYLLIQLLLL